MRVPPPAHCRLHIRAVPHGQLFRGGITNEAQGIAVGIAGSTHHVHRNRGISGRQSVRRELQRLCGG